MTSRRHFIINGASYSRQFIIDVGAANAAKCGVFYTSTNRHQAAIEFRARVEYSSTPEGVCVNPPGVVGVMVHDSDLRKYMISSRWFQRHIKGRGRNVPMI